LPEYRPGDYLQIDIPAYAERSLQGMDVAPPYLDIWQSQRAFEHTVCNPAPCRRNYSLATNPAIDKQLRFNIRLATPPRGVPCYVGIGSSYLFGLKPGNLVPASGPFGEFHVRKTDREMIYLGGGAGMAPLRSHLSYLLETLQVSNRISYWYGARSRKEMFYQDYFESLARSHRNFTFHVALSEPQPGDQWQSHTGLIHEVLKREYLDSHPDPSQVDYFLCGPPAMIQVATVMLKNFGVPPNQVVYDEF